VKTVTSTGLPQTSGNSVRKAVRDELSKYLEPKMTFVNFGAQVSANGTIQSLTQNLAQGDGPVNNYTGYLIKPTKLQFRCSISTDQTFNTVRLMIFRWKDSSLPAPSGILDTIGGGWAPHSGLAWVNRTKIGVLYDKLLFLKPRGNGYDNQGFEVVINLQNGPPIALPTGTGGSQPQMNGLYCVMVSDDLLTGFPAYVWTSRLEYTDA